MPKTKQAFPTIFFLILSVFFLGCGDGSDSQSGSKGEATSSTPALTIVSGSENEELQPLIEEFSRKNDLPVVIKYMGSVDMMLALAEQGAQIPYDAVWPANSLWVALGDHHKAVGQMESIMRSPVILGVKKSMAQAMGWTDKAVAVSDMLAAAREGKLRFSMTSATQSNSGSSAYLGFLHALAGSPDVLRMEHLSNPQIQSDLKELLSKINRSSGSSGWLKTTMVEHPERFQAMINYESMIIEANRELMAKGQEPLYAIYPADGIMIADSPLGYVDKGDPRKKEIFAKLQQHLLSDEIQQKILAMGRRTGLVGLNPDSADKRVFNPDWGIDIAKIISPIPTPSEEVIRKALELYQVSLRKPSCTAYVVDVSGSMEGKGIEELKAAMATLLDPAQAARYLLQPSAEDVHIIVPFNSQPLNGVMVTGNGVETMNNLLNFVQSLAPGGGTDIYSATARAIDIVSSVPNIDKYFPAIILMTDGQSKGEIGMLKQAMDRTPLGHDIPIHSITFGDASETQLKEISEISIGRVFHGQDLIKAFRQAKGYN